MFFLIFQIIISSYNNNLICLNFFIIIHVVSNSQNEKCIKIPFSHTLFIFNYTVMKMIICILLEVLT